MTTICLTASSDTPLLDSLRELIARRLPPGCAVLKGGAEITLSLDFPATPYSQPGTLWALAWANGTGFTTTASLAHAACRPYAVVELLLLQHSAEGWKIVRRAAFSAVPGKMQATLNLAFDRAAIIVTLALKENRQPAAQSSFTPAFAPVRKQPFALGLRLIWRRLWDKIYSIVMTENWMTGIVDLPIAQSLRWTSCPKIRWLGKRSGSRYFADPFMWPNAPGTILCEEYDIGIRWGSIKRLTLDGDRILREDSVPLPQPGHASFPFLFEHEGQVYCLPETSAAGRLMILRWENEVFREYATPLGQTAAADSILFEHEGYFWIAYTDLEIGRFDNLNLCYAKSLTGPWHPHPGNPVKLDPYSSRCGGTPFRADGSLYRPAQDCSASYGCAIRIMRVVECTPQRYHEEEITLITPEQGLNPHGFHTLSSFGDRCLVDGKRMVFSLRNLSKKVKKRWRRAKRQAGGF